MPSGSKVPDVSQDAPAAPPGSPSGRQASHATRLRTAGLVPVAVWVPASRAADIHAEAVRLRVEAGLLLPAERDPAQLSLFPFQAGPGAMP